MNATDLLIEAVRAGVLLQSRGGALHYSALRPLPQALARQLRLHRRGLLALLDGSRESDRNDDHTNERAVEADSKSPDPPATIEPANAADWTIDELSQLARHGKTPADVPLLAAIKAVFDQGATLVDIRPAAPPAKTETSVRSQAAAVFRAARRISRERASEIREAWRERLAICMIDGGLTQAEAETVALQQIKSCLTGGEHSV